MGAVIDQSAYDVLTTAIDAARAAADADVICGGSYSDDTGYFVSPTVIQAHDPHYDTMEAELFGRCSPSLCSPTANTTGR